MRRLDEVVVDLLVLERQDGVRLSGDRWSVGHSGQQWREVG